MAKQRRTPAEIIAEQEQRLLRLKIKQAKTEAQSDPSVQPILVELDDLAKEIREARKGLGKGPQSFGARISKHELWIEKIEAEQAEAEDTLSSAEQRKDELDIMLAQAVESLVGGQQENTLSA